MHDNYVTDESCAPYTALSWKEGRQCTDQSICKECPPGGKCILPKKFNKYHIGAWGTIPQDVAAIQNEIFANGPVTCSINIVPMWDFVGTSVFKSDDQTPEDHCVSVVGWGEEDDGTPYWIMRNSFGEYWGDNGFAKVFRGNNTLQLEQFCSYAVPLDTWSENIRPFTKKVEDLPEWTGNIDIKPLVETVQEVIKTVREDVSESLARKIEIKTEDMLSALNLNRPWKSHRPCLTELVSSDPNHPEEVVTSALPQDYLDDSDIPENFNWQNVDGVNYLSWVVN